MIPESDYLRLLISLPEGIISPVRAHSVSLSSAIPKSENFSTINVGTVTSPLIDHIAFAVDIDVFREAVVPAKGVEEFEALFSSLHGSANEIFESLITEKAKRMFS